MQINSEKKDHSNSARKSIKNNKKNHKTTIENTLNTNSDFDN